MSWRWWAFGRLRWEDRRLEHRLVGRDWVSQYYELDGVTLWNPSNGASRLFLCQARVFEAQVGVVSGIGPMEADESQVSLALFEEFVSMLLAWRGRTSHAVVMALCDGFIATCLVLAERAGARLRWPEPAIGGSSLHDLQAGARAGFGDEWQVHVREQAALLAGFMPR
jgi:hypothetical protein